ncbi:hypothetical protein [Kribbella flavida]|uniref:hypothetical protein n=1 Tax=Kribbella flavida TaxID=182640 RepID=UPI0011D1D6BD|nr:hypothetical protein [Kribbella flavida]
MTENAPDLWTTALHRNGRLVLPARPRVKIYLLIAAAVLLTNGGDTVNRLVSDDSWSVFDYFDPISALLAAGALVTLLNNLRIGRYTLTVDSLGVTLGRTSLRWPDITRIELDDDEVVVHSHPTSGTGELRLTESTLHHPQQFATWLQAEHRSRR